MVDKNLFLYDLAVVAIFKDEAPYLKEWLDYHLLAGVEHFYLYNNDSSDDCKKILAPYVEKNLVTLTDFPGKMMQYPAYEDAIEKFRFECRYMAFIDLDEFIFPKVDTGGGALSKSSTKFYRTKFLRRVLELIGSVSARTDKTKQIILSACWKDLLGVRRAIGETKTLKEIFTEKPSIIRASSAIVSVRISLITFPINSLSIQPANPSEPGTATSLSWPTKLLSITIMSNQKKNFY